MNKTHQEKFVLAFWRSLNLTRPLSLLHDSVGLIGTDEGFAEPEPSVISEPLLKKKKIKLQIKFLGPRTLRDPETQDEFASW